MPYPPHWEKLARKELGGEIGPRELEWITPEGIKLKPLYTGTHDRKKKKVLSNNARKEFNLTFDS